MRSCLLLGIAVAQPERVDAATTEASIDLHDQEPRYP
jgi:hypothetical protein